MRYGRERRYPHRVAAWLDSETWHRLTELSERYNRAPGSLAREAISCGLKQTAERLRNRERAKKRRQNAK